MWLLQPKDTVVDRYYQILMDGITEWFTTEIANKTKNPASETGINGLLRFMINYPMVGISAEQFDALVGLLEAQYSETHKTHSHRVAIQRFRTMYLSVACGIPATVIKALQHRFIYAVVQNAPALTKRDVTRGLIQAPSLLVYPILYRILMQRYSTVSNMLHMSDKDRKQG